MADVITGEGKLNPEFRRLLPTVMDVLERGNVKRAWVFGSACTENFNELSDIDLLIDLEESDPLRYAAVWWKILFELEDSTGRSVDLVSPESLTNTVFKQEVLGTAARLV